MDYREARMAIREGKYAPVYVCYGSESYLHEEFIRTLTSQLVAPDAADFAVSKYDLTEIPLDTVIDDAETLPFLAPTKVVVASHAGFFTGAKDTAKVEHRIERLAGYLKKPADSSILVFTVDAEKLDERKKIVKMLKDRQALVSCPPMNPEDLLQWVQHQAEVNGATLSPDSAERLILRAGTRLSNLSAEIEKLSLYAGTGGRIGPEDVERLIVPSTEQNVFMLIEEAVHLRLDRALSILYELVKQKEEPVKIMLLMARQFRLILQVKELERQGYSLQQIASRAGAHPYAVKLASQQARRYRPERLNDVLYELSELDYQMKSGRVDKLLGLEMFLLKLGA
jgi:DNA polymerase-3 subunit delta